MKHGWIACLFLSFAVGCVELPVVASKKELPPVPVKSTRTPAVTPEQVNESNARAKVQALRDELDRAVVDEPSTPPASAVKTK